MDSENGRMTREEYRAQMGLDAEPNAKREKSGDAGARLILLQLIICAAAVGLIFGIRRLSPASFETIKNTYKSAMQYSINAREAWGKIKSAAGFVFEPAGAFADSDMSAHMPGSGRVSSPFGRREDPFTGEASLHSGLDIAAAQGSPISAAFYGTVTKVGEDEIAGKYIRLTHADGLETFYCHCSEILAPMNAVIRQGETIALVGSTGMATGIFILKCG